MPRRRDTDTRVASVDRKTFLSDIWSYKPGQHTSFLGPTGAGKTTLAYQLLRQTATKETPAVVMVMKPRDDTAERFTRSARYRKVRSWPPPMSVWQPGKQAGYTLWPPHSHDPEDDDDRHFWTFRSVLRDTYRRGGFTLFADEIAGLIALPKPDGVRQGLAADLERLWMRGRSMGTGLWAATQRPAYVPLMMYDQAEHLFLAYDPDQRAQIRFREIGGVDPDLVGRVVAELPKFSWLYIRRADRTMIVVGP